MRSLGQHALLLALALVASGCTVETLVPGSSDPKGESAESGGDGDGDPRGGSEPSRTIAPSEPSDASAAIALRVSGDCAPSFHDLVVSTNTVAYDSIAIANANAPLEGSFQIQLVSGQRELRLSSKERSLGRDVVSVTAGGVVYTNMCNGAPGGCEYDPRSGGWKNDPVSGTVKVSAYDPRSGTLRVELDEVVLASTRGAGLCKIHGTVETVRLGR